MAKKVKITKGGQTVYPATVMDAVVHPDLRVDSSKLIEEVNVSKIYPTGGIDGTNKYTLETAIAKIPSSLRNVGLKCSFLDEDGELETWEYQQGSFINPSSWIQSGGKKIAQLEAQQNYLFAGSESRNANIVASGYYDALIDAYIPLTPIAGAKYYLTVLNKTNKTFSLYYTTTGELSGNTNVYNFKENSTFGDYTLMKTNANSNAWVIVNWNKLANDITGYYEGMELNPRIFKNPNLENILSLVSNNALNIEKVEAQQNYLFAKATSRNANIVATGYYQALIDAYIPLTPIAGAKYYLTVLNKTNKTFSLYYTTTGEPSGNTNVCDFKENSTFGDYALMKTNANSKAWVIINWNKLISNASGYYDGMELNPRVFNNPNYDSLLAMINTANSNISDIDGDISEINGSINKTDSAIDALINELGLTYSGFILEETLNNTAISERGETFTSSLEKSTVLKLSTGLEEGAANIFLKFNGYNIGNSYYAIKGHDGENLKVEKPTQVDTEITFTGDVSEVWIVVSSDDTSYSGYVLSGDVSIEIPPTDFSSIINTVISEDTLTGLLVANMRTNLETGALQATTMFSYYEYAIPKGALKVKTKLTTYTNCGLCFYDEDGVYISGLNATTAEGGGATVDYNGRYYEVDIPSGAASLKNSVLTTGDGSYWIPYSAGDMTFIFDNLENNIQEQIDKINEKIDSQTNPTYLPTFPQVANFMPPKKELTDQIKILFIGSSWLINTYWYLNKITQAAGINAYIETAFIAGGSFSQWIDAYNNSTQIPGYNSENGSNWLDVNNTLKTLFAKKDWDIVCFQQGALVGRLWTNFEGYWKDWLSIIRRNINSKAILCYNATWTPAINVDGIYTPSEMADLTPYSNDRDGQTLWQKDNNENIAKFTTLAGLQNFIAPCGAAVYAARRNNLLKDDNHDYTDDGIHLNSGMPTYIPAATWYETFIAPIYGISIDTIDWIPDGSTQKCAVSWDNYTAMTEQHRQEICKIVKLAASDRLGLRVL